VRDDAHADAGGRRDGGEGLHEALDGELRRTIGLVRGLPDDTTDAGDRDQAPTCGAQMRQDCPSQLNDPEEVDLEARADRGEIVGLDGADVRRPGVVEHRVQMPQIRDDGLDALIESGSVTSSGRTSTITPAASAAERSVAALPGSRMVATVVHPRGQRPRPWPDRCRWTSR